MKYALQSLEKQLMELRRNLTIDREYLFDISEKVTSFRVLIEKTEEEIKHFEQAIQMLEGTNDKSTSEN